MRYDNEPEQPKEWGFIDELKAPVKRVFTWERSETVKGEADLSKGIEIIEGFPDSEKILDSAYMDLRKFFVEAALGTGKYRIVTAEKKGMEFESYELEVNEKECIITAGDSEGIRRGIFYIEDLLLASDGPFLKIGKIKRRAWVKTRVSRCFFGPIKRPPFNRDELLDDVDYYPEEYLNRLAHENINGLWLTITFKDLCKTSISPEYGKDAEKRLAKLRRTVEKCRRYGIKTYIFCIEPAVFKHDDPLLKRHPELAGAEGRFFCPFSDIAQKYLFEAVNGIFTSVPNLGGMINISLGERGTTCLSSSKISECPVCSKKKEWEILHASLSAMEKGMRAANSKAELISWLYVPLNRTGGPINYVNEIAAHTPENVILQYNFESGGEKEQLNKMRFAGDYWLSYVGPSSIFKKVASTAVKNGTRASAKLQVGCSHEVASVPFVPVPSQLYKKYREMKKLGVSAAMQCWYFGNYPGIMNKAAGELSFEPFPENESDFLERLLKTDWGKYYKEAASAFKYFADAYENYPVNVLFQYYGPMHDGVVWPLHLIPVDKVLAPTWKFTFPTSGDRIGECFYESHSYDEILILCRRMAEEWDIGVKILKDMESHFKNSPERMKDINVAEALGIQFRSGYNILRFYYLREKMIDLKALDRLVLLNEMEEIAKNEISLDERLLALSEKDPRLGFHSESEGYRYFPAKIKWRMKILEELLKKDFPAVRKVIENGEKLFPEYTGEIVNTKEYLCNSGETEKCGNFEWKAFYNRNSIRFEIECSKTEVCKSDIVTIYLQADRIWPVLAFRISEKDVSCKICKMKISETENKRKIDINIPFKAFGKNTGREISIKANIVHEIDSRQSAWIKTEFFKEFRLFYWDYNPQNMGFLRLDKD